MKKPGQEDLAYDFEGHSRGENMAKFEKKYDKEKEEFKNLDLETFMPTEQFDFDILVSDDVHKTGDHWTSLKKFDKPVGEVARDVYAQAIKFTDKKGVHQYYYRYDDQEGKWVFKKTEEYR